MLVTDPVAESLITTSLKPQPKQIRVLLTAYVPADGSKTATGRNANLPGIAADFTLLPRGTKVSIPGKGTFVVDDTGGDMRKARRKGFYHIDLRIPPSHRIKDRTRAFDKAYEQAFAIGKRWVDVEVVYPHEESGL